MGRQEHEIRPVEPYVGAGNIAERKSTDIRSGKEIEQSIADYIKELGKRATGSWQLPSELMGGQVILIDTGNVKIRNLFRENRLVYRFTADQGIEVRQANESDSLMLEDTSNGMDETI